MSVARNKGVSVASAASLLLLASLRRHPLAVLVFSVLSLFALLPIWCARFLPLLDQPYHLSAIAIWHRMGDPSWGFDRFYSLSRLPAPYWGYYFPVHILCYLLPIEIANKVYLSLYALALPASVAVFARQFGRSPWVAVFAFPLVFNFSFGWGFLSYCAALPVLLVALVMLDRYLDQPDIRKGVALGLLVLATYFMHLLPWMILGACALVMLLSRLDRPRAALTAALLMLPSVGVFAINFKLASRDETRAMILPGPLQYQAGYETLATTLSSAADRLTMGPALGDTLILLVMAACFLLLASTSRRVAGKSAAASQRSRPLPARYLPELFFVLSVGAYLFLPLRIVKPLGWWNVNPRLAALAALFGATLLRGSITGARRLLFLPVALAFIYYSIGLSIEFRAFNRPALDFASVMERVPRGSSTLFFSVEGNPKNELTSGLPYYEFGAYAQVLRGGFNPFHFNAGFPFQIKPGKALPAPEWSTKWGYFTMNAYGRYYDYLLTYKEAADGQVLRADAARIPLFARQGDWRLYALQPKP